MENEWRVQVDTAVRQFDTAVRQFTKMTGVTRAALAVALGLYDAALYPSHLNDPKRNDEHRNRILFALGGHNLFRTVRALSLDDHGMQALQRLSVSLYREILGIEVDLTSERATRREALEMGQIAVEQFDLHQWEAAAPRLQHAWGVLSQETQEGEALIVTMRVGLQLATWHNVQARPIEGMRIVKRLLGAARDYCGSDPMLLHEIGNLFLSAAMADRLQKIGSPDSIIRTLDRAADAHRQGTSSQAGQIIVERDKAKPYLAWAHGWYGGSTDQSRVYDGEAAASRSEALAGGEVPLPELRIPWLLSRFTRIEVLASDPFEARCDEVRRLWDCVMEAEWAQEELTSAGMSVTKANAAFAAMAVEFVQGDLEALASLAQAFQADRTYAVYQDRIKRASKIQAYAIAGDIRGIQRVLVE